MQWLRLHSYVKPGRQLWFRARPRPSPWDPVSRYIPNHSAEVKSYCHASQCLCVSGQTLGSGESEPYNTLSAEVGGTSTCGYTPVITRCLPSIYTLWHTCEPQSGRVSFLFACMALLSETGLPACMRFTLFIRAFSPPNMHRRGNYAAAGFLGRLTLWTVILHISTEGVLL